MNTNNKYMEFSLNYFVLIHYQDEMYENEEDDFVVGAEGKFLVDASLLKLSALSLLHSLSRSVHQLRTKFLDIKLTNSVSYLIRRVKMRKDALNEEMRQLDAIENETMCEQKESNVPRTDDYNRIDFSLNEQNFISLLLAILANLLIDFSPCKEVNFNVIQE
jgi:hypothetical protein